MIYEYWYAGISGLNCMKKKKLREILKTAEMIYYIEEIKLTELGILTDREIQALIKAKKQQDIKEKWEMLEEKNIRFIPYFSEEYPVRLKNIPAPPYALYVRGRLPDGDRPAAALVGARNCTHYGERMALEYGEKLAENGISIISGMARGIDGAGQRGALNAGGMTYGILGCGVDICYPKQNYPLMRRMLENGGGVLSEFPPGAEPLPWHFPIRNRVISALADVVIVIEAKEKSGSLITADYALEQGKTVFALPGRTTDATSRGCNRLIAQGAEIAISPETILEELGVKKAGTKRAAPRPRYGKEAEMVLKTLAAEPQNLAQLAGSTGIPLQELTGILLALEIDGVIAENPPGVYMALS